MGVVWRATDGALGRDAAIKVLPDVFAENPDRLARFEREAKLLASLNHRNIAAVYGLHAADGVRFLAMEMVRGEDLAQRLTRGRIPVDEVVAIGRQIADALETAHESGVIHRDLKPANVRVTDDGTVKVLDFGLAKALDPTTASSSGPSGLSPTVTSIGSVAGLILGTAAYMSPEQARGKPVDRRTDIWAFGCVLYEMLTGKRPFDGETVSDSIAKILQTEPDFSALPAGTPRAVRDLIKRCLEKDARRRLRDMGDARIALEDALRGGAEPAAVAPIAAPAPKRGWLPWAVAAVAVFAALASTALALRPAAPPRAVGGAKFLALNAPEGMRFDDQPGDIAVAPDGGAVAVAIPTEDGTARLFVRKLDAPDWRSLPGTEGAQFPFWSADGRYIGFFAANKMKKVAVGGGTADTICDAAGGRGGTWNRDGVIVFAPGPAGPLMQVRAEGGEPAPATELDTTLGEVNHRFPRFLPDGKRFLYATLPVRDGRHETYLATLGSKERKLVVSSDGVPSFAAPDRLVYRRNKTLFVQSFDPDSARLSGEPRAMVEAGLRSGFMASPTSSVAGTGVLAFVPPVDNSTTLTWFTLDGVQGETLPVPTGGYFNVRFSPDGSRLAVARFQSDNPLSSASDIWLVDLERKNASRVTFDPQFELNPNWAPDGRSIFYGGNKTGAYLIYRKSAEGAGDAVAISEQRGLTQAPDDVTPDGRRILYERNMPTTGTDLMILDTAGGEAPAPYLATASNEKEARIAPGGRWVAYTSDETGRDEVYIQSFPTPGSKVQVSTGGADIPVWSRDGRRLFFYAPDDSLIAVDVTTGDALRVGAPSRLFRFPRPVADYDLAPDGKRIIAGLSASDASGRSIGMILDWDGAAAKEAP